MDTSDIAAVVVHHRSPDSLGKTVGRLLDQGVLPNNLVVVDNSENPVDSGRARAIIPMNVAVILSPNLGYGAAVNRGVRWHVESGTDASLLLVSTHESLPEPGAIQELQRVLLENPKAAVVGPALVTGEASDVVWSLGGYFTRSLNLPRHHGHKSSRSTIGKRSSQAVDWLDGAFLLFRREVLEQYKIDERFFLYLEETDHQRQLTRSGWEVLVAPQAVVWQSSNGIPPYYQTRNIQLFQAKNGNLYQRFVSAPYLTIRGVGRSVYRRQGSSDWKPLVSGLVAGLRFSREDACTASAVHIVNPLGGALAHYTSALESVLRGAGVRVTVSSVLEPSMAGTGRMAWLAKYAALLFRAGRNSSRGNRTVVVWPVLGFVDLILARLLSGKMTSVVYHDPKPLVRAIGTGKVSAALVSSIPFLCEVIVHSETAAQSMRSAGLGKTQVLLRHPMFAPREDARATQTRKNRRPVLRVLGQYKQDRDLEVLRLLSSDLREQFELEIVGRGWPDIEGWRVDARFVSELELDELVRGSDAILIPYKRFYQSGIAVRALEWGTPVVGRAGTSLDGLYGEGSRLLVAEDDNDGGLDVAAWSSAIRYAVTAGGQEAAEASRHHFDDVLADWESWLASAKCETR
ncbi:glycosyltransferase [Pseudarthrobacter sp. BRE9]|uniref:glycosyltransferase n=1 Tax=Pseudarthrobacter sp. BRE9 TaxID=2962582 RepID=UPI002881F2D2|nr:glycosyltransferase [Pseudarthrobacter sp. BRE9]MDT0168126.1 glycosyltransferase [Pseudarthrobacter sp. BRE9]